LRLPTPFATMPQVVGRARPWPTFFVCRKTLDRLGDQETISADC
jgi:hypothetical protein